MNYRGYFEVLDIRQPGLPSSRFKMTIPFGEVPATIGVLWSEFKARRSRFKLDNDLDRVDC